MNIDNEKNSIVDKSYEVLLVDEEFIYVRAKQGSATAPMVINDHRYICVTINKSNEIKFITFYNEKGMRYQQIDLKAPHVINGVAVRPHKHIGFEHCENGSYILDEDDKKIVEKVKEIWYKVVSK